MTRFRAVSVHKAGSLDRFRIVPQSKLQFSVQKYCYMRRSKSTLNCRRNHKVRTDYTVQISWTILTASSSWQTANYSSN